MATDETEAPDGAPSDAGAELAPLERPAAPARRTRPSRRLLLAVSLAVGTTAMSLVLLSFIRSLRDAGSTYGPKEADEFVRLVALGERADPNRPGDERCGYALAWEGFSPMLKERCSYLDLFEDFALLVHRFGAIRGIEREKGSRFGERGARVFTFRLLFGDDAEHHSEMTPFELQVTLARVDGAWAVDAYAIEREGVLESR